jgi:hypothetical protein
LFGREREVLSVIVRLSGREREVLSVIVNVLIFIWFDFHEIFFLFQSLVLLRTMYMNADLWLLSQKMLKLSQQTMLEINMDTCHTSHLLQTHCPITTMPMILFVATKWVHHTFGHCYHLDSISLFHFSYYFFSFALSLCLSHFPFPTLYFSLKFWPLQYYLRLTEAWKQNPIAINKCDNVESLLQITDPWLLIHLRSLRSHAFAKFGIVVSF